MRRFFAKPFRFAIIYAAFLTAFTGFVLSETVLIPREREPIAYADLNSAEVPENALSESSGDSSSENGESNDPGSETLGQAVSSKTASEISETAGIGAESSVAEVIDTSDYGFTENSYKDENISLTITTKRIYDTTAYIADIRLSDVSQLKTAFAQGKYGRNIVEKTSETAANNNAIFAINGDYYGFREAGFVARNGALYRDTPRGAGDDDALVIYGDGSFETVKESESEATELFKKGAYHIFSFGPTLVENGEIVVGEKTEVKQCMVSNPRTAIGILEPLHYIIIVSDGRTEESAGLSLYQLGDVMKSLGCEIAYNLDGGGSATMWFNGGIVNVPKTDGSVHDRRVSDIGEL